jgi:uncharacterized YigZ family protein
MTSVSDSYITIQKQTEGFYKDKGSKFTAYAIPCTNEEEAKNKINLLRKENPTACHVCFAWRFGTSEPYSDRYSDDGEPSNSAGKPIFGQIVSFNLTNILIAVVRIYGGTNLGVGGLMSAYKKASKEALDSAIIQTKFIARKLEIVFPYSEMGNIMNLLNKFNVHDIQNGFEGELGKVAFEVRISKSQSLIDSLKSIHTAEIKTQTND